MAVNTSPSSIMPLLFASYRTTNASEEVSSTSVTVTVTSMEAVSPSGSVAVTVIL